MADVFVITTEVNLSQPTEGWWIVFDAALKFDSSPSLVSVCVKNIAITTFHSLEADDLK